MKLKEFQLTNFQNFKLGSSKSYSNKIGNKNVIELKPHGE